MTTDTTAHPTLRDLQAEIMATCEALGWYEDDRTHGEDLALLHSEASEALEAYRDHGYADATSTYVGHAAECGDNPPLKPEGVGAELADVVIRLLDTVGRWDMPDPWWLEDTLGHVIPFRMPLRTFGDKVAKVHHSIAVRDFELVLRTLLDIAVDAEVDLEHEVIRKMAYNRTRPHRHGGKRL